MKQILPLVEQLPPLYMDLVKGREDFIPKPEETRRLVLLGLGKHKWALKLTKNNNGAVAYKSETGSQASVGEYTGGGRQYCFDLCSPIACRLIDGMVAPSGQWENATAGAVAGFATVAAMHPLDVVRTRFQVNDGRGLSALPTYKNTAHAVFTIARLEGLRGLYAGFFLLSSVPLFHGAYTSSCDYGRAKERYARGRDDEKLTPPLHLASAAEAGALVCLCTNPIWLVKTRLQLQTPLHQTPPYSGLLDAFRTIMKEEGPRALFKGIVPGLVLFLQQVSHGAIQFTAYEELRKVIVDLKENRRKSESTPDNLLNSRIMLHWVAPPKSQQFFSHILFRLLEHDYRPSTNGIPRYIDSLHVIRETARFEGLRGFYRGLTANLLKNVPASSITFIVYKTF
ncbi:hypothetical protein Bca101_101736 [Brassica carinata]